MNWLSDFFFPKTCVGCKRSGAYFCDVCINSLEQSPLICPVCTRPAIGGATHPLCLRPQSLDGLWSLASFKGPLKEAIHKLKYRFVREIAASLVEILLNYWVRKSPLFIDQLKASHGKNWLIVPVPLHVTRQNWRGFNQSALLAELLAKKIGLHFAPLLERSRNTQSQVGLARLSRKTNIRDAFTIATNHELRTMNILLLDDVWTTGSTLRECAKLLKRSGAHKVWALTLAR